MREWQKLFPLPWVSEPASPNWVSAKNGQHALDIRGWGYLTGKGGGLALDPDVAIVIQNDMAAHVVRCVNEYGEHIALLRVMSGCNLPPKILALVDAAIAKALPPSTSNPEGK